jgi:tetraacyldisaccharide 4'-kinase
MQSCCIIQSLKAVHQKQISASDKISFISRALMPAAWIYGAGAAAKSLKYKMIDRTKKLDKPVISVGNITVGGTGKTPFIIYLGKKVRARGKKCAILMRGYGRDEVSELEQNLADTAVIVDKDRFHGAQQFVRDGGTTDVFLMDDGFQHRELARDLNIVLINGMNPFGNGLLLPAGSLREPLNALGRADLFAITHADQITHEVLNSLKKKLALLVPQAPSITCVHAPVEMFNVGTKEQRAVHLLKDKKVIGFCGIGFAKGFRRTLEHLGAHVVEFIEFLDHERYAEKLMRTLKDLQQNYPDALCVTTEKDLLRDQEILKTANNIWVVRVSLKVIEGESYLNGILDRILSD